MVVTIPFLNTMLIALDHLQSSALKVPSLSGPIGFGVVNGNGGGTGYVGFGGYLINCFANANAKTFPTANTNNLLSTMLLDKSTAGPVEPAQ